MSSNDEVEKMMKSMIKIRNDVDSRYNKMVDLMEANVELELKQKKLLKEQKSNLAIAENGSCEKIELQIEVQISFF